MPFEARVFQVLIASPGDVVDERDVIEQTIHRWNSDNARANGVLLMPRRWESDSVPEFGDRPQGIINRQLVDDSDMIIGAFWTRVGSPTGLAPSGTAEEIERGNQQGKPVAIYFSERPAELGTVDPEQLTDLRDLKARLQSQGLTTSFTDHVELERSLISLLTRTAREKFGAGSSVGIPTVTRQSTPKAALRASVAHEFNARGQKTHRVVVRNVGSGMASSVTISPANPDVSWRLVDGDKPVGFLPSGSDIPYLASVSMGSPQRVDYVLAWTNEDGWV